VLKNGLTCFINGIGAHETYTHCDHSLILIDRPSFAIVRCELWHGRIDIQRQKVAGGVENDRSFGIFAERHKFGSVGICRFCRYEQPCFYKLLLEGLLLGERADRQHGDPHCCDCRETENVTTLPAVINQMRGFLLEHGIIVRQGLRFLRQGLPDILAKRTDVLSPRMVRIVADLASDWRQLDERIEAVTDEIETLAKSDDNCRRVMTVPGIGPIISSAMVAAIGSGGAFARGRDFSAWIGLVPKQMSTGDRTILGRITKRGNSYFAYAVHASCPGYSAAAGKLAKAQLRDLARARRTASAPQRLSRGSRQQAGADRLDRAGTGAQL